METQAPTRGRLALMAVFALSCFALLLYLWSSFGGPYPLKPKGYRFAASFEQAPQLAEQADVRISGVPVGKVIKVTEGSGRAQALIEMRPRYAPIPVDTRAILRQKTLLGETFVELTPGSPTAAKVPEGGTLANTQVESAVQLDQLLATFDRPTRTALQLWMQRWSAALRGRGAELSDVIGELDPVTRQGNDLLAILDSQRAALSRLIRDTGVTFDALGRNAALTQGLITAGRRVAATTAARAQDLRQVLGILPTFLHELRPTLLAAQATSQDAAPVIRALGPAAPLLRPVLAGTAALSPHLRELFVRLDPVITAAREGLPALTRIVRASHPLLDVLYPIGRDLLPIVQYLYLYRQELVTSYANISAATQGSIQEPGDSQPRHYLRVIVPVGPEGFVTQGQRLASNRHNPYFAPRALDKLATGLEAFDCQNVNNPQTIPLLPGSGPPPCRVQSPLPFQGRSTAFPHLLRAAP
ncbi:MAG: MCE family protein [Actinobacteria bacterium]|nr:MAG: MCE family protein [Actinomycetota bacterium]